MPKSKQGKIILSPLFFYLEVKILFFSYLEPAIYIHWRTSMTRQLITTAIVQLPRRLRPPFRKTSTSEPISNNFINNNKPSISYINSINNFSMRLSNKANLPSSSRIIIARQVIRQAVLFIRIQITRIATFSLRPLCRPLQIVATRTGHSLRESSIEWQRNWALIARGNAWPFCFSS